MPVGLYAESAERVVLKDYEDAPLSEKQYRVRVSLASLKHGTSSHTFDPRSPFARRQFDQQLRLFVPRQDDQPVANAGGFVGNMFTGTVSAVGSAVERFRVGDRVYGYGPIRETATLREQEGWPLVPPLTDTDAVCQDPGVFALAAVRDAQVCLGDSVVLFGLGAIGLLGVQMLRAAGCLHVAAVDPVERRRKLAERLGAHRTFDPTACDVAMEVRRWLGAGADKAIEASGSYAALHEAIRSVRNCARVVTLGFYKGADSGLELGADFFHNRIELIASLPAWGNPMREYPLWDNPRLERTVAEMFRNGMLNSEPIVDPIVSLSDAPAAYVEAMRNPANAVKFGVRVNQETKQ